MNKSYPQIRKASGAEEPFSVQKLENSLLRAGSDEKAVKEIISQVQKKLYDGITTRKIYKKAFKLLAKQGKSYAARYSLKRAIMELGPTGYPFEHFVGQILLHLGFKTEVGQLLEGSCVKHEVDVVATGTNAQYFIECKYYNNQGKYADVKVPMYIKSRFEDIVDKRQHLPEYKDFSFYGWIVTNTRFTTDALAFGKCSGLHLISWDFPRGQGLKDIIEKDGLFPITVLTSIRKDQKQILLDKGIVLCSQIFKQPGMLNTLEIIPGIKQKIMEEINELFHYNK